MFILNFVPDISVPPIQIVQMNSFWEDVGLEVIAAFAAVFIAYIVAKITSKKQNEEFKEKLDAETKANLDMQRTLYLEKMEITDLIKWDRELQKMYEELTKLMLSFSAAGKSVPSSKEHQLSSLEKLEKLAYFSDQVNQINNYTLLYSFPPKDKETLANYATDLTIFYSNISNVENIDIIKKQYETVVTQNAEVLKVVKNKKIKIIKKMKERD